VKKGLYGGRWVGRYWRARGFVEPERLLGWVERAAFLPVESAGLDPAAFQLEIDGQSAGILDGNWRCREVAPRRTASHHAVVELRSTIRAVTVGIHTEVDGTGFLRAGSRSRTPPATQQPSDSSPWSGIWHMWTSVAS